MAETQKGKPSWMPAPVTNSPVRTRVAGRALPVPRNATREEKEVARLYRLHETVLEADRRLGETAMEDIALTHGHGLFVRLAARHAAVELGAQHVQTEADVEQVEAMVHQAIVDTDRDVRAAANTTVAKYGDTLGRSHHPELDDEPWYKRWW